MLQVRRAQGTRDVSFSLACLSVVFRQLGAEGRSMFQSLSDCRAGYATLPCESPPTRLPCSKDACPMKIGSWLSLCPAQREGEFESESPHPGKPTVDCQLTEPRCWNFLASSSCRRDQTSLGRRRGFPGGCRLPVHPVRLATSFHRVAELSSSMQSYAPHPTPTPRDHTIGGI